MKKQPIYYKTQIVGYVDDIIYNGDIIELIKMYLFYGEHYKDIVENVLKTIYLKINIPEIKDIKYEVEINDDFLICKIKK